MLPNYFSLYAKYIFFEIQRVICFLHNRLVDEITLKEISFCCIS